MLNALDLHRVAQTLQKKRVPVAPRALRRLVQFIYGPYIGAEAEIGPGTELAYGGMGIVIHPAAKLGRDVLVGPHVTIGGRSESRGAPSIGDRVRIGAGACLLGDIRVGEGALIGANAVVTRDVPAGAVMAGVPAKKIGQSQISSTSSIATVTATASTVSQSTSSTAKPSTSPVTTATASSPRASAAKASRRRRRS